MTNALMASEIWEIELQICLERSCLTMCMETQRKFWSTKCPKAWNGGEVFLWLLGFWSQKDFVDEFTTTVDVTRYSNNKIYVNWRLLDKYKGRFRGHGLTRNMIDTRIYIPDCNLYLEEHFCFRYFACSCGSPDSLLRTCIKEGIAKLYDRYYVTTDYHVVVNCQTFCCYTGSCSHQMDAPIPDKVVNTLPAWYYKNMYPLEGQL